MSNFEIWKNQIKGKVFNKQTITKRINMVAPLFTDEEFAELLALIETTYS